MCDILDRLEPLLNRFGHNLVFFNSPELRESIGENKIQKILNIDNTRFSQQLVQAFWRG